MFGNKPGTAKRNDNAHAEYVKPDDPGDTAFPAALPEIYNHLWHGQPGKKEIPCIDQNRQDHPEYLTGKCQISGSIHPADRFCQIVSGHNRPCRHSKNSQHDHFNEISQVPKKNSGLDDLTYNPDNQHCSQKPDISPCSLPGLPVFIQFACVAFVSISIPYLHSRRHGLQPIGFCPGSLALIVFLFHPSLEFLPQFLDLPVLLFDPLPLPFDQRGLHLWRQIWQAARLRR